MIRIMLLVIAIAVLIFMITSYHPRHPGNLVRPVTNLAMWHWDQLGTASGRLVLDGEAVRCRILKVDKTNWHLQLYQTSVSLVEGRKYRVRFTAMADRNLAIQLVSGINHGDFHTLGLEQVVSLTPQWRSFDFTFEARHTDKEPDRIPAFIMGDGVGSIWIKDLTVEEAG